MRLGPVCNDDRRAFRACAAQRRREIASGQNKILGSFRVHEGRPMCLAPKPRRNGPDYPPGTALRSQSPVSQSSCLATAMSSWRRMKQRICRRPISSRRPIRRGPCRLSNTKPAQPEAERRGISPLAQGGIDAGRRTCRGCISTVACEDPGRSARRGSSLH